jgi:subtilisin family serine protease
MLMLSAPSDLPLRPWDDLASGYGVGRARALALRTANAVAREYHLRIVDDWPMPALGVHCVVVGMEPGQDVHSVLAALNSDQRVGWAQPVQRYRTLQRTATTSNDAAGKSGWDLSALHAIATGRGVTIAEVDTGVDLGHPNLVGQWFGPRDFVATGRFDAELHGTAVAGLIVAHASAKTEGVGVAPGARLMPLRACWQVDASAAECTSFTLAKALQHALREHAHIINLSLTGPPDLLLGRLIDRALEQGAVVVAAADDSADAGGFPAQHPGVIAAAGGPVAGLERTVQAPSRDLLTTIPGAALGFMSGSSFAAAQVTGLIALLLERSPRLRPTQVRAILTAASASDAQPGGCAPVDPCAALLAVIPDRGAPACARTPRAPRLHQAAVR